MSRFLMIYVNPVIITSYGKRRALDSTADSRLRGFPMRSGTQQVSVDLSLRMRHDSNTLVITFAGELTTGEFLSYKNLVQQIDRKLELLHALDQQTRAAIGLDEVLRSWVRRPLP